ncbi:histone-lysine N-methyltransferase [Beauveria bassiana ARSEF 2860]|uniref:Histone-lysine N-methyltransferase n=1 Tax=Beauveria bassiana (strain ARSEF 2860) TaxID=655819 RepID=J4VQL3_BEAB2|nr:histone-lysine N-methyltransferase [Beauveria bassiana ARSEF 2860]EJP60970.1 histone-lysine N-methyltransferase [Beauveria bassiana ARSEF 2860]
MKAFATLRASLSPSGRFTSRIQASTQRRAACRRRCELLGGNSSPRQHSQNQTTDNEKFTKRSRSTPPVWSQRARSIIRKLQKLVQAEPLPCGSPGMLCDDLCQNRRMDYWCDDDNCSVGASCTNRCIDNGQSYYETYYTMHKGQGLRSTLLIPPNTFLGEYEGKYITREQALRQCRSGHNRHIILISVAALETLLCRFVWNEMQAKKGERAVLLARHVGKTFEAVSAEASEESANLILSPSSSKLYAENEQLRTENLSLSQQVQQLSDALEKETEQKLTVVSQNEELRQDLQSAKETIIQRTDEVLRYQTALSNWFRELDKAMPALDDLRHTMIEGATM